MKTNQLMKVAFGDDILEIFHKSKMGSLTDLLRIGNKFRVQNGLTPFVLQSVLKQQETKAYIKAVCELKGIKEEEVLVTKGRGRGAKTFANLFLLIYIAERLNPMFHAMIVDTFINQNLLQLRDQGGNDFKRLNRLIDTLEDRTKELKPKGNRGCYIQVSKMLREKIFTKEELESVEGNIWNSSLALKHHQELREEYETKLCSAIELGLVKTYSHLIEVIEGL